MRIGAVDRVAIETTDNSFPITITHESSPSSTVFAALMAVPALIMVAAILVAATILWSNPVFYNLVASRPATVILPFIGLLILSAFLIYPLRRAILRIGHSAIYVIDGANVTATKQSVASTETWVEPMGNYRGIRQSMRTSLSGTRNELVLEHIDPDKSVLLHLQPTASAQNAETLAEFLEVPLLSTPHDPAANLTAQNQNQEIQQAA